MERKPQITQKDLQSMGLVVEGAYGDVRSIRVMNAFGVREVPVQPVIQMYDEGVQTIFRPSYPEARRMRREMHAVRT